MRCLGCSRIIEARPEIKEGSKKDFRCPHCGEEFVVYRVKRTRAGEYKRNKRPTS